MHTPSTTDIYTLSLHDALPICIARAFAGRGEDVALARVRPALRVLAGQDRDRADVQRRQRTKVRQRHPRRPELVRSEEHTSELQSRVDLVCRLLLEKKKRHRPI